MSQTETVSQYNDKFNEALQWMWGDGYLAPGGPEEVAEMLCDLSINCLLYTSPSPRDRSVSRMPSSA